MTVTAHETTVFDGKTERQKQVLQTLEQGTEAILTSEGYQAFLRMQSKFWNYSFNNTILIMAQRPEATKVNSYKRWQELGRQVQKGEKGISIYYPILAWEKDPDTGERVQAVKGFGIGNVFDVAQTEGEPLPEPPHVTQDTSTTDASVAVHLKLSRWLFDEGVALGTEPLGQAGGYWSPTRKAIVLNSDPGLDPFCAERASTLVHESAHYLADHRGKIDRGDAETVAESTAFVVMDHFGVDTADSSFAYVASWAKDKDILKRNLGEVQKLSSKLIGAIEGVGDPFADRADEFIAKDPWEELRRLHPDELELPERLELPYPPRL